MSLTFNMRGDFGSAMTPPAKETTTTAYGSTVNVSTNVMLAAVIFFFILVLSFVILYLYAKHVWAPERRLRRRRSRLIFAAETVPLPRRGLDSTILRALPITIFSSVGLEEELECAVCLCELADGEEVRMLPKCNHGFHLDCIDMWFHSHSNCPLCRSPVGLPPPKSDAGFRGISAPETESAVEFGVSLFDGTADAQPSSSVSTGKPDGMLMIDIPKRVMQGFSSSPSTPLPTSNDYENQMMTTKTATPTSARLRTLTRLLSRGKRAMVGPSAASPREIEDIEQGQGLLPLRGPAGESRRGATPRIPKNS